jgi:hypothetical protein
VGGGGGVLHLNKEDPFFRFPWREYICCSGAFNKQIYTSRSAQGVLRLNIQGRQDHPQMFVIAPAEK